MWTRNDELLSQYLLIGRSDSGVAEYHLPSSGIEKLNCNGQYSSALDGLYHCVQNNLETLKTLSFPPGALLTRLAPLELELLRMKGLPENDDELNNMVGRIEPRRTVNILLSVMELKSNQRNPFSSLRTTSSVSNPTTGRT